MLESPNISADRITGLTGFIFLVFFNNEHNNRKTHNLFSRDLRHSDVFSLRPSRLCGKKNFVYSSCLCAFVVNSQTFSLTKKTLFSSFVSIKKRGQEKTGG